MNCDRTKELLVRFEEGDLDEQERETVAGHLESCAGCKAELDNIRAAWDALAAYPRIKASGGFVARVLAAIGATSVARKAKPVARAAVTSPSSSSNKPWR